MRRAAQTSTCGAWSTCAWSTCAWSTCAWSTRTADAGASYCRRTARVHAPSNILWATLTIIGRTAPGDPDNAETCNQCESFEFRFWHGLSRRLKIAASPSALSNAADYSGNRCRQ